MAAMAMLAKEATGEEVLDTIPLPHRDLLTEEKSLSANSGNLAGKVKIRNDAFFTLA